VIPDVGDVGDLDVDGGGHLGWRISALLDDELSLDDELAAREHLAGCDVCQQEFAEVTAARAYVRGFGEVEPPRDYIDRVLARMHRRQQTRFGLVSLVAVAAIWIVILIIGASLTIPEITPPVSDFVDQHEIASADPDRLPQVEDVLRIDSEASDIHPPYVLPEDLTATYQRVAAYDKGDGIFQGLYRSDEGTVSLFEQEGSLDWDDLPADGERTEIGGRSAWVGHLPGDDGVLRSVVVIPEYPVVYTLVTEDAATAEHVAPELPEPQDYTFGDRARQSVDNLARRLGLD
jgi:hypothetical protein